MEYLNTKKKMKEIFIIIYSYFWNLNEINAYLKFNEKESFFVDQPTLQDKDYADKYLTEKWDEYGEPD